MPESRLRSDEIPRHVAIIMDGNGRWAEQRGISRLEGHREGLGRVRDIVRAANELGIQYLTLYAFSLENWNRPKLEVDGLMRLLSEYLDTEIDEGTVIGDDDSDGYSEVGGDCNDNDATISPAHGNCP